MVHNTKIIIGGIVALLVIVIVLQNTEVVETRLLFTTISMPRASLLFGTLIIGYVLGLLTAGKWSKRKDKS